MRAAGGDDAGCTLAAVVRAGKANSVLFSQRRRERREKQIFKFFPLRTLREKNWRVVFMADSVESIKKPLTCQRFF